MTTTAELETRIRASLRTWAAEIDDADEEAPTPEPGRPAPVRLMAVPAADDLDESGADAPAAGRSPIRLLVLAGAAAVLVLVVAIAVLRSPTASVEMIDEPPPTSVEELPGPRAVATALPPGFQPIWTDEHGPTANPAGSGGLSQTIQRFDVGTGSVTVVVQPLDDVSVRGDASNGTVRGQPASMAATGDGTTARFIWDEPGATIQAFSQGLDEEQARATLDSLVARTDDAADGFDAPTGAAIPVTLRAEQVWRRGSGSPATSTVAYAATGSTRWSIVVSSHAPAGNADLDLLTSDVGVDRQVIAGQERAVVTPERVHAGFGANGVPLEDVYRTVAWFDTDGALIEVQARDLDAAALEAVIAGIDRADEAGWSALPAEISTQVESLPVATRSTWGDVELTMRGDAPSPGDVLGQWQPAGACLRSGDAPARCGSFPGGGVSGSATVTSSTGWFPSSCCREAGRHLVTVATPEGWWLFGALDGANDDLRVSALGEEVERQWVTATEGSATTLAAFLPLTATHATITISYEITPPGSDVPATGVPQRGSHEFTVDAPAR